MPFYAIHKRRCRCDDSWCSLDTSQAHNGPSHLESLFHLGFHPVLIQLSLQDRFSSRARKCIYFGKFRGVFRSNYNSAFRIELTDPDWVTDELNADFGLIFEIPVYALFVAVLVIPFMCSALTFCTVWAMHRALSLFPPPTIFWALRLCAILFHCPGDCVLRQQILYPSILLPISFASSVLLKKWAIQAYSTFRSLNQAYLPFYLPPFILS